MGGTIVGLLLPLSRSPWGSALLSMLGVFPLYFGVDLTNSRRSQAFGLENVAKSAVVSFSVGGALGVWAWLHDHPHTSGWIDALRHPTPQTMRILWAVAVVIAGASYFGLSPWTGDWPPTLVIFLAVVLFILPLGLAGLVTLLWMREHISERRLAGERAAWCQRWCQRARRWLVTDVARIPEVVEQCDDRR